MITIDGYPIDCTVNEDHQFTSAITDFPVEEGADVTDNQVIKPARITLDGLVTNTPIGSMVSVRLLETSIFGGTAPATDAYLRMKKILNAKKPVTIVTSLDIFKNMLLETISFPRDAKTGKALRFKAAFKEVRFVTNARTTVRVSIARASSKSVKGNKDAKDANGWTAVDNAITQGKTQAQIDSELSKLSLQAGLLTNKKSLKDTMKAKGVDTSAIRPYDEETFASGSQAGAPTGLYNRVKSGMSINDAIADIAGRK